MEVDSGHMTLVLRVAVEATAMKFSYVTGEAVSRPTVTHVLSAGLNLLGHGWNSGTALDPHDRKLLQRGVARRMHGSGRWNVHVRCMNWYGLV